MYKENVNTKDHATSQEYAVITIETLTRPTATTATPRQDDVQARNLISVGKVEGTVLFDRSGEKIGTVRDLVIDKLTGNVRHVVIGFGGLLGMGEEMFPMPWDALIFDADKDGYVTDFDRDKLIRDKAPKFEIGKLPVWNAEFDRLVKNYYLPR